MFGLLVRLARHVKESAEWWGILAAFGLLPGAAVIYAIIQQRPADVILLYAMAGVAFLLVVVAEIPVLQRILAQRRAKPPGEATAWATIEFPPSIGVATWSALPMLMDRDNVAAVFAEGESRYVLSGASRSKMPTIKFASSGI